MKKLILSLFVAGLMITSAWSLNSCKKANTNSNANNEEWIPTTYSVITEEEPEREGADYVICYFCQDTIWKCLDNVPYVEECFYCPTHSHIEWFEADEDCYDPYQTGECEYKFVRRHRHIITYTPRFHWHSWHIGGGAYGGE